MILVGQNVIEVIMNLVIVDLHKGIIVDVHLIQGMNIDVWTVVVDAFMNAVKDLLFVIRNQVAYRTSIRADERNFVLTLFKAPSV